MNYLKRMKDIREDRDLTQGDIATVMKTTRQQVSKWENGTQIMGIDKLIRLAQFYDLSTDYLLGLTDTPRKLNGSLIK